MIYEFDIWEYPNESYIEEIKDRGYSIKDYIKVLNKYSTSEIENNIYKAFRSVHNSFTIMRFFSESESVLQKYRKKLLIEGL